MISVSSAILEVDLKRLYRYYLPVETSKVVLRTTETQIQSIKRYIWGCAMAQGQDEGKVTELQTRQGSRRRQGAGKLPSTAKQDIESIPIEIRTASPQSLPGKECTMMKRENEKAGKLHGCERQAAAYILLPGPTLPPTPEA